MKKAWILILSLCFALVIAGCSSGASGKDDGELTIAWLPNESGADMGEAREEIGKAIEEATGQKVKHQTTTDYIVAIEAIANGKADLAFLGAQGYIEANEKNKKVEPLVVSSGESGTLEDAIYHSWLTVKKGNEQEYEKGGEYTIDGIKGKRFSFVSNSSTSGFQVPSTEIGKHFSEKGEDLAPEDLMEGGEGKFFSEVLFGGSHQGSAVNLLTEKADAAAFCDTCVANYVELEEGKANEAGSVYKVKEGAAEPFQNLAGEQFTLFSVTPVLNAPIVINSENVDEEAKQKILDTLTSEETKNNEKIFVPEGSETSGLFEKASGKEQFVKVEDKWFNPIRELQKK
ncbi:phosphate/phosphite/phosphonate ABC transporter substrate-binding protein [Bacillus mangrovi]|uniref:Phosphate/phosphite/phosphonate ABC transporter substrate-binding protein n=1 Tax=Metabacillus mangrovi TaxID=1491830 RepID=A0A7X2V4U9_9BACI|nr:phosphate/phosphite/phosphonate ABC transporter substrate-binding protein [Metabacillus mangrovi]MTH53506.1 phosphate/phosphite/phosphonate ABC transporter substrate-binding protein [Metabacillus mangrovi]